MTRKHSFLPFIIGALVMLIAAFFVRPVLAHERVELGPYVVVVGWVKEPAIVGERNGLFLQFTQDEEPVEGVAATLDAELQYAGRTFRANLEPTETPGIYTAELLPTVRGQYSIRLFGSVGELEIDEIIDPEEVFPASRIQFPETQPSLGELQKETDQKINELESQLQVARLSAFAALGVAVVGVALAGFSLRRRN